jgi:membrane protein required for colicin V production
VSALVEAPLSWFDVIILAVIVVSTVMSLGRGLIREAFSVISFIVGFATALVAIHYFKEPLASVIPKSWPVITPVAILFVVGFLTSYSLAAFVGSRLSKLIHASPEIGVLDRLAGAAFGTVRGVLAAILFVLLMHQVLPDGDTPTDIAKAKSYPYLNSAASWVQKRIPNLVEGVAEAATPKPEADTQDAGKDDKTKKPN